MCVSARHALRRDNFARMRPTFEKALKFCARFRAQLARMALECHSTNRLTQPRQRNSDYPAGHPLIIADIARMITVAPRNEVKSIRPEKCVIPHVADRWIARVRNTRYLHSHAS